MCGAQPRVLLARIGPEASRVGGDHGYVRRHRLERSETKRLPRIRVNEDVTGMEQSPQRSAVEMTEHMHATRRDGRRLRL